ncbi:MAG: glycine cleavage system aminomethyltransferase GcvT [Fervidicoccaceae archaeon]|jgi:aminomethyltransferase
MFESPLKSLHEELNASFGEFAGWNVPMDYGSIIGEHLAVRKDAGIFDITHMGRIKISGKDALELLEVIFSKKIQKTKEGFMSGPTLALNELARVIDDEMLYRLPNGEFLSVTNAAFKARMIEHLTKIAKINGLEVMVEDISFKYALFAVQGPRSKDVLDTVGLKEATSLAPLQFTTFEASSNQGIYLISRSGWTGEDGFEIWVDIRKAGELYKKIVSSGAKPVGIAARDSLRMEMGFVLGGNEYGEDPKKYPCAISLRYGMGAIDWDKSGFVGEEALRACRREGARWLRYGFIMKKDWSRFIPRKGNRIFIDDVEVGWITSGSFSPILNRGIAQGYLDSRYAITGEIVEIVDERGRKGEAKIEDFPLIKSK